MFTAEIRTNRPWQVLNQEIIPYQWMNLLRKSYSTVREVEIELAWLLQKFENCSAVLSTGFKVEYRILNDQQTQKSGEKVY